jgi:hypothetical protein
VQADAALAGGRDHGGLPVGFAVTGVLVLAALPAALRERKSPA